MLVASAASVVFTRQASAQSIGDEVGATLVEGVVGGDSNVVRFGRATVVDPGIEFETALFPTSIGAFFDISEGSVEIGFVRTIDSTDIVDLSLPDNSEVVFAITDLVGTGNPLQVELEEVNELPFSTFGGNPEDFVVTTTPTSISIFVAGGFTLREQEEISLRYRVSAVPEPTPAILLLITGGAFLARRRRS